VGVLVAPIWFRWLPRTTLAGLITLAALVAAAVVNNTFLLLWR
jgi:hypothetical protein